eukprot:TRINITY_DN2845_c0_g1_i1.p1 TRINITY_DN2845_c0_g1~~TRINITY_DN2845_c0_g1_i1.p1  ORF type:complete len:117 (-),score=28.54 TRINITY_DN2845_c0_g1_i1:55-405(-)
MLHTAIIIIIITITDHIIEEGGKEVREEKYCHYVYTMMMMGGCTPYLLVLDTTTTTCNHTNMFANIHYPHNTKNCLLYTSDAADEEDSVDLGGRRIIKKKKKMKIKERGIKNQKKR